MNDEQASDWEYKIICCLGISTSNSDINVVGLHKTVTELYEQGRADEREAQVCCGDYEKCMKACTPRGRWLAKKELTKPEQEHKPWCDFLNIMLTSLPPKKAKCNCKNAPPKHEWVGLTDMDIHVLKMNHDKVKVVYTDRAEDLTALGQDVDVNGLINAIQTKLKELNT